MALIVISGLLLFGENVKLRALPDYEGEIHLTGVKNPIQIFRDSFAISHIQATTDEDAYYALGYVHAQERMFQMDFTRRVGRGLLSQVLGEKGLIIDKWARTIGFSRIAYYMWQQASADTRKYLSAYTNGVNSFINTHHRKFGVEFDALSYEPELWKPTDCMLIGRLLSWEMNFAYWTDAAMSDIALAVDSAHLASLYPGYPSDAPTVLEGYNYSKPVQTPAPVDSTSAGESQKLTSFYEGGRAIHLALESVGSLQGIGGGSNAIAISGKRTSSGGAMLENDMHLAISTPARWYLTHLQSKEGLNVAGFTVPGLPLILSGRNLNISWGLTNGMIDECDYFILDADSGNATYKTPNGTNPILSIEEHIPVRMQDGSGSYRDEKLLVKVTDNGPIVGNLNTFELGRTFVSDKKTKHLVPNDETVTGLHPLIALQWNGNFALNDELGCFFKLHHAKTIVESKSAMIGFATPCLNLVVAESKTGDISYQVIGRIPLRNGSEERAMQPRHANNRFEIWQGFVTTLPYAANPSAGYFVSANNPSTAYRSVPQSENWEPPGRAERLVQLVEASKKMDVTKMRQIMTDVASPFEKNELASQILRVYKNYSIDSSLKKDPTMITALDYLENWDGTQSANDISTTIVNTFFLRLITNCLADEIGTERLAEFCYLNNFPPRTIAHLLTDSSNIWWDDTRTPQRETRDDIIRASFIQAITYLKNHLGSDIRTWNWGKFHWLTYKHPFADESPEFAALGNVDIGYAPGGLTSVVQSSYGFWNPFRMRVGPSMRSVSDMSTTDFYVALPTGNSGNMFSPNFRDMKTLFDKGELIKMSLTKNESAWKKLTLLPE